MHLNETILIVDDDEMTRLLLVQALVSLGVSTIEAVDGEEAMQQFERHLPELVLLDVDLPKCNGFEVCKAIRRTPKGADVPIVMITGKDDTASIEQAYQFGATDFIVKPINWALIAHHVRYVLRSSRNFKALKASESKLEYAQEFAKLGHWRLDLQQDVLQISRPLAKMFQLDDIEFPHGLSRFLNLVHPSERLHVKALFQNAINTRQRFDLDVRMILLNERLVHAHMQGQVVVDDGVEYLSGVLQDISELKESQAQITHIAHHDPLTDLPNRVLFQQQLESSIVRAKRNQTKLALLYIDLDRFKNINDSLGHDMGDLLLQEVAKRITSKLRTYDLLARLGGDEFAIILEPIKQDEEALLMTHQLLDIFEAPFALKCKTAYARGSIGICLFPDNGTSAEELQRNADSAMYQAKRASAQHFAFYSHALTAQAQHQWTIENGLRNAIEQQDFELVYQPKVAIDTQEVVGVEALLRWTPFDKASIPPNIFIPIAEETGLIIAIGEWVIQQAISQLQRWQNTNRRELSIAINVSGRQLHSQHFTEFVETSLEAAQVRTGLLEFEMTEEYLVSTTETETCLATLERLKILGIRLAIDDFGTGYSSYAQLKNLPIHTLKIDKSFIDNLPEDSKNLAIVKSMINLADNLGMQVVAEGVETHKQLQCLRQHGAHLVQGFYFAKPVAPEMLEQTIEEIKNKRP
ncbi:two-component system response regulator [Shewanella gelidii]|uniref:Two-component system response regulator n=1 Tax=Shewanella gelidii TaxID=1642821 RepID=A0A917JRM7_9GAMM|nr:EAL domain-containing protein [Shewanella gelidii]MCL1097842.1 EAL domain-containing protein [Shewanella gelidii]GGI78325.1 two-component system response regulator [Shewanella gelidii]